MDQHLSLNIFETVCERIEGALTRDNLDECKTNKKIIYINGAIIDRLLCDNGHTLTELCNSGYIDGNFRNTLCGSFFPYPNLLKFIDILLANNVYVNGDFFLEHIFYVEYYGDIKKTCLEIFHLLNDNYLIQTYDFVYCSYFCVEMLEIIEKNVEIDYNRLFIKLFKSDKFINEYNYCLNKLDDLSCVDIGDIIANTNYIKYYSINILIEKGLNIRVIDPNYNGQFVNTDNLVDIINTMQIKYISIIDSIYLTAHQFAIFSLKVNIDKLDLFLSDNKIIRDRQPKIFKSEREKLFEKYDIDTYGMLTSLAQLHTQPYYSN